MVAVENLIQKQKDFFQSGQTLDYAFRIKQLETLEVVLRDHEKVLQDAVYKDFKKSPFESFVTELGLIYMEIKEAKRNLRTWMRPQRVPSNLINFPAKSFVLCEPFGVSLVIGAWNYPYLLLLSPAIAAMAAGNTVVLKPSEIPSETAKVIHQILSTSFDPQYLAVVQGGVEETTRLLQQNFDKIFFTGSTEVGKIIYRAAAEKLIPVTLELGGKSPAVVTPSCNLKMTAKRLVWGKFLNAGQTCVAPDYVMVHQSIETAFLEACKNEIEKAQYAFGNSNYCQIINRTHFNRLVALIDADKVFYGGTYDSETRYIAPTLLQRITFEDAIMKEEIFGPLLPVLTYQDFSIALQQIKELPKPLSAYLFTANKKEKKEMLQRLSFGGGAINDVVMQLANLNLPFGGIGNSGMGSYHGKSGFLAFSHQKSILQKATWLELPLKYAPLSARKLWLIRQVFRS
jgi:aldehyde dehydrogenase (NAD+)